uniref:N-acetyltransferase domain-containing protein n=1 Tax=Monopterus albus TaxID=43700 RepID=A0A3Q3K1Z4_MONAL
MRINENTLLEGKKAVLVPYNANHVPSKIILPLLKEKLFDFFYIFPECTFIILDKQRWADPSIEEEQCMVGDVNMFLTDPTDLSLAELEIMIAEPSYRGKGIGKEVAHMMMCYGVTKLGIKKFQVKIGLDNQVSISMFKKLHFQQVSVCKVFKEVTLVLTVDESVRTRLSSFCTAEQTQQETGLWFRLSHAPQLPIFIHSLIPGYLFISSQ